MRSSFLLIAIFFLLSCKSEKNNDVNLELTDFAKDLVSAYKMTPCNDSQKDSTTYVFRCFGESFVLFAYQGFSHTDLIGKAIYDNNIVKVYGTENDVLYTKLHKIKKCEKYDTDGDYVEDLKEWVLTLSYDTIFLDICDCDEHNILRVSEVCKNHFPNKILIWQRSSFRLNDIQL